MKVQGLNRMLWVAFLVLAFSTTGCARLKELENINRQQAATIASLNNEITRLSDELDALSQSQGDLARAKAALEKKLSSELADGDLNVRMSDRGIIVTVLDRVLFDAGKAQLKTTAEDTLQKVADILVSQTPDNRVFVEGHTDSDPIRASNWRSNWELSTARATEVIHYFIDQAGLEPDRFVASGYGEFEPVVENIDSASKSQNRRVEIVISPSKLDAPIQGAVATGALPRESEASLIK